MTRETEVHTICKQAGYAVLRVVPYGKSYRVYVETSQFVTQSTLSNRLKDTLIVSNGFGVDRTGIYIGVEFR